jgi:hypothetical protein
MEFEIRPLQGVGPLDFGMPRDEVRRRLNSPFEEFMKTPDSVLPTDDFQQLNIHVYYEGDFVLYGVEFWPGSSLTLQGKPLVGEPFDKVMAWFTQLDPSVRLVNSLVVSRKLGVSLYAPDAEDEPDSAIASASAVAHWP